MDKGFIKSKINIPKVKDKIVKREDLFNKLNEAINYKLILVTAPAGFGKSTLIASWLNFNIKNKCFTAWLSLSERDSEAIVFWKYVVYALDKIKEGIMENSILAFNSFQFKSSFDTEILAVILNNLDELRKDLFLVIDDLYMIDNKEIYEQLKFFIRNVPPNVHIVIISRAVPDIGISKLRATDNMLQLSQKDLSFTQKEIETFFKEVMDVDISNGTLNILEERTEGWAVGLQMAGLSLKNTKNEETFLNGFKGDHRYVLDYLMEEVFSLLDRETQDFLMKTSILGEMNSDLCNRVTQIKNSQELLEKIDTENLFMIPLDENKEWYRYHHLFKEFLGNRRAVAMEDILPELYNGAAEWHKENGFYDEAINFYIEAKNYDEARIIIEKIDMDLMFSGDMKKVYDWCMKIPKEMFYDRPRLCMNAAWFKCASGDYKASDNYLKCVEQSLKLQIDEVDVKYFFTEIMIIRGMLAILERDITKIKEYADKAKDYGNKHNILKAANALLKGTAAIYEGDVKAAAAFYEECLEISKNIDNYYTASIANRSLIISKMMRGKIYEAEKQCIDLIEYLTKRHVINIPAAAAIYNDLADIYYEWNELDKAVEWVKKALELAKKGEVNWILCASYMTLAKIFFAGSNIEDALKYLSKSETYRINDKLFDVKLEFLRVKANLHLRSGNFEGVENLINNDIFNCLTKFNIAYSYYYLTKVRYLIFKNALAEAEILIISLSETFEMRKVNKALAEALILKSIICEKKGNTTEALEVLIKAINISYKEKYLRIFLNEETHLKEFILSKSTKLQALLKKEAQSFLNQIIENFNNKINIMEKPAYLEILSVREIEVLKYLQKGLTNLEIAEALFVSVNTVKTHLLNIYTKLDVHSRTEALTKAKEFGIF
ncbi:hypothetical protein I6U48_07985 [Clostridium sp. PL3]|uniref:HTH luxR-type domain-containing protein n=1 Tax=Clostridium thailandense TaxID=2794346 RepID=A0A949TVY1_9CLOT|nr:LuxR C-terminal-related transcriptional regulator [Clostridium thailandense]MBV7272851.1 hypothetical protein [Clostridium thailandense]